MKKHKPELPKDDRTVKKAGPAKHKKAPKKA